VIETTKYVPDKITFIKGFSNSSKLRGNTLHLGKVFFSRKIVLTSVIEGRAKLSNSRLGRRGDMVVDGRPCLGRRCHANDVYKHIGGQGIEDPP
jgi:hypothetical protein